MCKNSVIDFCLFQTRPVPFTVQAVVTNSDMEFDQTDIDFGCCTIHECVKTTVKLSNNSVLPQQFGFVGVPEVRMLTELVIPKTYAQEISSQKNSKEKLLSE